MAPDDLDSFLSSLPSNPDQGAAEEALRSVIAPSLETAARKIQAKELPGITVGTDDAQPDSVSLIITEGDVGIHHENQSSITYEITVQGETRMIYMHTNVANNPSLGRKATLKPADVTSARVDSDVVWLLRRIIPSK